MTVDVPLACDTKINMEKGYDNPVLEEDGIVDKCNVQLELNESNTVDHNSSTNKTNESLSSVYVIPAYSTKATNEYYTTHSDTSKKDNINKQKNDKEMEAYSNGTNGTIKNTKSFNNDYADYDPYKNIQHSKHPTTYWDTMFHLLKASLGTGILAMPNAFHNAGYAVGMIGTLIVGFLCTYNVHMLVSSEYELCKRKKVPCMSYPETLECAFEEGPVRLRWFAPYAKLFGNLFLVAYQLGCSAIYVVFIASNLQNVYDNHYHTDIGIRTVMLYILVPLVLVCCIPNLKLLVPFSTIANFITMISFLIIFYFIFTDIPSIKNRAPVGTIEGIPLFFGTVLFAMEAIGVVMPLKNEMKKPKKFGSIFGVLNASMLPISLLYALIGFFGFLKYGDKTEGSITLNLPNDDIMANMVKLMYSGSIFITYALSSYVAIEIIWINALKPKFEDTKKKTPALYILRILVALLTFFMAAAIPNLELFISFIGAFCLSTMGIAFPAVVEILVFWCHRGDRIRFSIVVLKNIVIILIAMFAFTIGITSTVVKFINQ